MVDKQKDQPNRYYYHKAVHPTLPTVVSLSPRNPICQSQCKRPTSDLFTNRDQCPILSHLGLRHDETSCHCPLLGKALSSKYDL